MTRASPAKAKRGLAFGIDRRSRVCLVDQLVASIRKAVAVGALAQDEVLPSFEKIAHEIGTSVRIPRDAVRRLCAEGVLASRRGLGTTVIGKPQDFSCVRLLIVHPNFFGAYYLGAFVSEIEECLVRAGYGVVQLACARAADGSYDFRSLDDMLGRERFDLAFAITYDDEMLQPLIRANLPYVVCSTRPVRYRGAVASIRYAHMDAVPAFAAHCVEKGVRSVLQMRLRDDTMDAGPSLRAHGIDVETLSVPVRYGTCCVCEEAQRKAMALLSKRMARGRLPELLFFTDDYLAMGGLAALAYGGIRIPQDIKVVSFANTGFGPVASVPLTRLAMDPYRDGRNVAAAIVSLMRKGKFDKAVAIRPDYIRGESF